MGAGVATVVCLVVVLRDTGLRRSVGGTLRFLFGSFFCRFFVLCRLFSSLARFLSSLRCIFASFFSSLRKMPSA